MAVCRVCGTDCAAGELRPVHEGGGCRHCHGSPACSRCGHPRRLHRGTFGGVEHACSARVAADVGLAIGRCGCTGYTSDRAAFGEEVGLVEVTELRLRRPEEATPKPSAAHPAVRDLFDEPRRLEPERLPWRPPR